MENVIKLSPVGAGSGDGAMKPEDIVLDIARNIIKKLEDNHNLEQRRLKNLEGALERPLALGAFDDYDEQQ